MDESASACDDFYRYACGGWVKRARLKPSQSQVVRPFTKLATSNAALAHEILHKGDGGGALLSTYYRSCMDEAAIDAAGTAPLARLLGLIDEAANIFALTYVAGKLQRVGVHCFFGLSVAPDPADSRRNLIWIGQKGLGMPGRSFYLGKAKAARFRQPYVAHVAAMLGMLAGDGGRHEEAAVAIYDFEVQLAKAMLPRTATMDPRKYKGLSLAALQKLSPGIEWSAVCEGAGLPLGIKARAHARGRKHAAAAAGGEEQADDDAPEFLAVAPAYVAALSKLLGATPYSTLQSYARFRLARNFGALLPTHMRREHFAFYYQTLRGQKAPVARDRECSSMATLYLGDALGERFVRLIDAAGSKAAASDLLARLKAELGEDLKRGGAAGWMGGKARRAAQRKLGRLEMLVGYPAHFDKYAPLRSPSGGTKLAPGTYLANTMRIAALAFDDAAKSLTRPVDRTKWSVPPSLANAYYDRSRNAMVVPAGILQPPMFDAHAPAVLNFGSIGTVVGHEMTHGFDAMGRMYDEFGSIAPTGAWDKATVHLFAERQACFTKQYSSFVAMHTLDGADEHVNGKLTVNENLADNGGVALAFLAHQRYAREYRLRHGGAGAPRVIPSLSNDQLFFVAFAQNWCAKTARPMAETALHNDVHSPPEWRVKGVVMNSPAFAKAFQCRPGSPMNPTSKCKLW